MSKASRAMREMESLDTLSRRDQWFRRLHPGGKLLVTLCFILTVVSFPKYDLAGIIVMSVFPILGFTLAELSFREAFRRLRFVLPVVILLGIANPFLDRSVLLHVGNLPVRAGVVSMLTLMGKAVLAVLASYLLIATTGIEDLCAALRRWHFPKILVTEILLIYRYVHVLLREVHRVTTAYQLRAPGQNGIHFRAWGPLAGQILLRSMDRAEQVYQSMNLRGFDGDFRYGMAARPKGRDFLYPCIAILLLLAVRFFPGV